MIEVWLGKTALTVRGHAGFSRYGSDIVCAAASMLAFALAEAVQAAGLKTPPEIESGCGGFRLEVSADKREQARLAQTAAEAAPQEQTTGQTEQAGVSEEAPAFVMRM